MTTCLGCLRDGALYYAGCGGCSARALGSMDDTVIVDELAARWAEYEQRKGAWLADNPGAYPAERESALANIAWEMGL